MYDSDNLFFSDETDFTSCWIVVCVLLYDMGLAICTRRLEYSNWYSRLSIKYLDGWLTVHLSITSCAPVKKRLSPFLTGAQDSHLQRVTIPEAAHIQLRRGPPDDEQG